MHIVSHQDLLGNTPAKAVGHDLCLGRIGFRQQDRELFPAGQFDYGRLMG
jgi:hypothetical protein